MTTKLILHPNIWYRYFKASYLLSYIQGVLKYRKFGNDPFLIVKPAGKKGQGLFTTKKRIVGELIFIATGPTVYAHFEGSTIHDFENWYAVDKDIWIDIQYPYIKINHSCDPNTAIDKYRCFYALRDINEGEELTFDYSTTEDAINWEMECLCGTKNCTGKIGSIQTLSYDRYRKSYKFLSPYFKRIYSQTHTREQGSVNIPRAS